MDRTTPENRQEHLHIGGHSVHTWTWEMLRAVIASVL
jgi:hypothetical protein